MSNEPGIKYVCASCGNTSDVEEFTHQDSQFYQECSCAEEMLPVNVADLKTMNSI